MTQLMEMLKRTIFLRILDNEYRERNPTAVSIYSIYINLHYRHYTRRYQTRAKMNYIYSWWRWGKLRCIHAALSILFAFHMFESCKYSLSSLIAFWCSLINDNDGFIGQFFFQCNCTRMIVSNRKP